MRNFFRQFTKTDYIFFTVCALAYYALIRQYLVAWDDLDYIFGVGNNKYITSLRDILSSQAHAYMTTNGRFIVHSLVQFFVSIGGLEVFYLCSTLFFCLLLMSGRYLLGQLNGGSFSNILFLVFIYLFMPQVGCAFFGGCAWTCNYMYSCAIYTFFLAIYYHIRTDHIQYGKWGNGLLCIFGILCGCWQESFSIGLSITLLLIHSYQLYKGEKIKDKLSLFWLVFGFGIGSCIGIFAPGNFSRLNGIGGGTYAHQSLQIIATKCLYLFKGYPILLVAIGILIAASIIDYKGHKKWYFIKQHKVYLISLTIGILFAMFIVNSGGRQFSMIILFTILIIISFIQQYIPSFIVQYRKYIWIFGCVVCICIYIPSLYYIYLLHREETKLFEEARHHPAATIVDEDFEKIDRCIIGNSPIRSFINTYQTTNDIYDNVFFTRKLSSWITQGETDTCMTLLLPEPKETIIAHCENSKQVGDSIYHVPDLNYFILRLPNSTKPSSYNIKFRVAPRTSMQKIKYKVLHNKCYTIPLQIPTVEMRNFTDGINTYYIFTHHILYDASPQEMWFENNSEL